MTETALILRQKLDLAQENRVLRSRVEEQDALIAELTQKLSERTEACYSARRQRNKYIERLREQSVKNFLAKIGTTCAAVFVMWLTLYAINTIAAVVMRWAAFR